MASTAPLPTTATRAPCPPGACDCGWAQQPQWPPPSPRLALLTPDALNDLLHRLHQAADLPQLRHLMARMHAQLGMELHIAPGKQRTQGLKGLLVEVLPQPGLCRKTRQAIAHAVRQALQERPHIAMDLLNENSLFS